ncbi:MAG: glycoside hydrolase family 6 protein [Vampirovibrionales bacterium]
MIALGCLVVHTLVFSSEALAKTPIASMPPHGVVHSSSSSPAVSHEDATTMPIRLSGKHKSKTSSDSLITDWTGSYAKYGGTHALWLDGHQSLQENLGKLEWILTIAAQRKQIPELVIYMIPDRDFSQSSAGGFRSWQAYLEANHLIAARLRAFTTRTGLISRVYLEPDSLGGLVEKAMSEASVHPSAMPSTPSELIGWAWEKAVSSDTQQLITARTHALHQLVKLYGERTADTPQGYAKVYLDAGNSGWIYTQAERLPWMARLLHLSGVLEADGITSNISNRFPLLQPDATWPMILTEQAYLKTLQPWVGVTPDRTLEWVVDVSRNGNTTRHGFLSKLLKGKPMPAPKRQFYLHPEGALFDNEVPQGRLIGLWYQEDTTTPLAKTPQHTVHLIPFTGGAKHLYQLIQQERYQWVAEKRLVIAPEWLDPVLDEAPGMPPTDALGKKFAPITHVRWIKPPDACDGALNCPPGASKSELWALTAKAKSTIVLPADTFLPNP